MSDDRITPDTVIPNTVIDGTAQEVRGPAPTGARPDPKRIPRRTWAVAAVAAPLALGAAGLSLAQGHAKGDVRPTPVEPVAIQALAPSGATAIKGEVAEVFGNKFVVQDATGRALVETGRAGEGAKLVSKGDAVTVQGKFEKGFLHAKVLTLGDGRVVTLGPAGGPPPGGLDWAKDKLGLGPAPDVPALTAAVKAAGYDDVRVTGRGPKHLEVAARKDGQERLLHVGFDGKIREKPLS